MLKYILVLLTFSPLTSFGQTDYDYNSLSAYKYANVNFRKYSDGKEDAYGLGWLLIDLLQEKGFKIIENGDLSNYPEAANDLCLVVDWFFAHPTSSTDNPFEIKLTALNCKNEIILISRAKTKKSRHDEERSNLFQKSLRKAFEPIENSEYAFSQELSDELFIPKVETTNETESSLIEYFNKNKQSHPIEGIYTMSNGEGNHYKVGIKKHNNKFAAIIIETNVSYWKTGEVKAYFTETSIPSIFITTLFMGAKEKIECASEIDDIFLKIKIKNAETQENITIMEFIKVYPIK